MLHPRASRPPSANTMHCTTSTEANVRNAAHGPRIAERSIPPTICPLDPVPGIAKFIIWAAKTNAPITPMSGRIRSLPAEFSLRPTLRTATPSRTAETAAVAANTGAETSASDMCMISGISIRYLSLRLQSEWSGSLSSSFSRGSRNSHVAIQNGDVSDGMPTGESHTFIAP